ncbi:unnamed protein product [Miscanthus lutarioriparius]|uniref:Uncharacterized protein n=1 Tax=Miscanthus lutarioriparius TaxID=422564 RepID=A0A811SAQ0_9POAL|nr:unnamed protein product [Miscanthus lutarioriparius]
MEGSFQLNPNASPFIPGSLGSFAHKAPEKQGGETKDFSSGSVGFELSDLLYSYEYTESSAGLIISAGSSSKGEASGSSFDPSQHEENDIDELALANMLNSQDMLHDDAKATNDLHNGQGVPGADYHNAEVSESSSKMSQDLQNEKSATSDVKSVLPKFSEINLLHNDLGLPDDEKSAGTSVAK